MSNHGRRTRADADRNRARVLEIAYGMFVEKGDAVQMAEIARAAGVGVGTVYRHFPTRQVLVEAVAEHRFREILGFARENCLPEPDTRRALTGFLRHVGESHESGSALSGAIQAIFGDTEPHGEVRRDLWSLGEELVARGTADGTLRPDATVADLYMIVGAVATISRDRFGDWRRFVDIALDGLCRRPA